MDKIIVKKEERNAHKVIGYLLLGVLFAATELLLIFPDWDVFLGPAFALLACYFYFGKKQDLLVIAILMFGNDALGTLVLGSVSTVYLIFLFFLYELLVQRKISLRLLVLFSLGTVIALLPSILGVITFKAGLFSVVYIGILLLLYQKKTHSAFFEELTFAVVCVVSLLALHLLITGGVIVSEIADRAGLIGVGVGDANYSALILCIGVAAALNYNKIHVIWRILTCAVMIAAMVETVSVSGLIALLIVLIFSFAFDKRNKRIGKILFRILLILLIFVLLFQIYTSLPSQLHIEGVDDYILRVEEKLDLAQKGDYDAATTDRSDLFEYKLNYFFTELPLFKQLFGFNALTVGNDFMPHNTYVDFLLHLGLFGAFAAFFYMALRLLRAAKELKKGAPFYKLILVLKLLFIFFAFTVSIYQGHIFALFFIVCFVF